MCLQYIPTRIQVHSILNRGAKIQKTYKTLYIQPKINEHIYSIAHRDTQKDTKATLHYI